MKLKNLSLCKQLFCGFVMLFTQRVFAQVPNISYSSTNQSFLLGTPITPVSPTNNGGAVYTIGQTSTFAGSGSVGSYDGTGTSATFKNPIGVAVDASGNVYVADRLNYKVRKITGSGVVSTLAGSGSAGSANGTGTAASFNPPNSVAVDASGNIYVADEGNNMIRLISPSGVVSTLAGSTTSGYVDATGTSARFYYPFGVAVDGTGNVYVADMMNGKIRKVTSSGLVTTLASGFGTVLDVACDAAGNVYVADANSHIIYKITPGGTVSTFAGSGYAGSANGTGTSASFNHPAGLTVDALGNVFVGDESNNLIRMITPAGVVTTLTGSGSSGSGNGSASSASFYNPCGIAVDNTSGSLYVADYSNNMIRKVGVSPYTISPALPPGLSFDSTTGTISGTPTAGSATAAYTVIAHNISGNSNTVTLNIGVNSGSSTPSDQNFLLTFAPRTEISDVAQLAASSASDVNQSITYFDGLGRPMQNVFLKGNGDGTKDLVQPISYDQYGREDKKYLPYSTSSGDPISYRANALTNGAGVYQFYNPTGSGTSGTQQLDGGGNPIGVVTIPTPFAQTLFEPSPLNRPVEQGAPGDAWQPGSGHTVLTAYGTNDGSNAASTVIKWVINSNGNGAAGTSNYTANTLYSVTVTDENGNNTITFKDIEGRVVCKKVPDPLISGGLIATCYIYDDYGNLAYVVPPTKNASTYPISFSETNPVFLNYIYGYHYDSRNRLVEKKIPGKDWEYTVYNNADQIVATQDGNQRAANQWLFTKYDGQGREIQTGIWNNGGSTISRSALATSVNSITTYWESRASGSDYTTTAWPTTWATTLSVNYYDDYTYPANPYNGASGTQSKPTGLLTAGKVAVLNPNGTYGPVLWTVHFYDDKGREVQTDKQHYLGAANSASNYDDVTTTYNFNNQVSTSVRHHYTTANLSAAAVTTSTSYYYDQVGRKTQTWEAIYTGSSISPTLLSQNDYSETGQLKTKHLHNSGSGFLQDINYTYNERGWLVQSNAPLFQEFLQYNSVNNVPGITATPQFNGNIASQSWGTKAAPNVNTSVYIYDALNRLTSANCTTGNSENNITYDNMGNITQLYRYQSNNLIDQLNYNYADASSNYSNKLQSISDASGSNTGVKNGTSAYTYDQNGNAITDQSRLSGAVTIDYNLLNLPRNISGAKTIAYTYDAQGDKLRRVSPGTGNTDYIGGIQYEGTTTSTISFIQTEEGRAFSSGGTYNYEYHLTDHLGNTRLAFVSQNGTATVVQKDDYYAFGMEINSGVASPKNNYLYNKKELQEELGQYDYGARFYDPVIGRWTSIDPMAEKSRRWSPYNFVENNPVRFIDPDGMFTKDTRDYSSTVTCVEDRSHNLNVTQTTTTTTTVKTETGHITTTTTVSATDIVSNSESTGTYHGAVTTQTNVTTVDGNKTTTTVGEASTVSRADSKEDLSNLNSVDKSLEKFRNDHHQQFNSAVDKAGNTYLGWAAVGGALPFGSLSALTTWLGKVDKLLPSKYQLLTESGRGLTGVGVPSGVGKAGQALIDHYHPVGSPKMILVTSNGRIISDIRPQKYK